MLRVEVDYQKAEKRYSLRIDRHDMPSRPNTNDALSRLCLCLLYPHRLRLRRRHADMPTFSGLHRDSPSTYFYRKESWDHASLNTTTSRPKVECCRTRSGSHSLRDRKTLQKRDEHSTRILGTNYFPIFLLLQLT